jgi:biotin-dependent carboxylase-like uncharacterized protein
MIPTFTVIAPGWALSVQDRGRWGYASLGVSSSGAMDSEAAALANRLVGNVPDAALLESAGGLHLRADTAMVIAVTGARVPLSVGGQAQGCDAVLHVAAGSDVVIGMPPPHFGRWAYVAVRGGLIVNQVLGSCSWDTLGRLGPPPPVAGERLMVGEEPQGRLTVDLAPCAPWATDRVAVRIWPGPRREQLGDDLWARLVASHWRVGVDADRVGIRLDGPVLLSAYVHTLPSEGLVAGAIQLPGDGRPIVMMRDHPTTGGYPVIAVVDPRDLGELAQRQAGEGIRMVPVSRGRKPL